MRNVIKLTESQLKKMVKDAINEQATTKYFDAFKKWADTHGLEGVGVSGDKRMRQYNFSKGMPAFEIMDDGSVVKIYNDGKKVNGKMSILSDGQIQISLDNGDTWTSTPKNSKSAINTNYFAVYEKANGMRDGGARLEPTKDPNCKVDTASHLDYSFYIWNNGTYMQQSNTDKTDKVMGKMNILSDKSYNIVFRDGEIYDSATNKIIPAPNKTSQINTTNCANQLIDIANDPSKRKILKFGCKTQAVKELQTLLDVVGKDGVPTGYFGSKTKQAVIDFQKKNKLKKIEGIVGPETYKALIPNAVSAPAKDLKEEFDDENDGENANEYLNSLFNTEDDYDGEPYRGDEEGFSNKMRQKHIAKSIKADHLGMGAVHPSYSKKKDIEIPRDEQGKEVKWSPMKSDDLPLDKYLEKKKMRNLDEEDLTDDNFNDYLDSLFVKD